MSSNIIKACLKLIAPKFSFTKEGVHVGMWFYSPFHCSYIYQVASCKFGHCNHHHWYIQKLLMIEKGG